MAALTSVNAAPMFKYIYADHKDSKTMLMNKPLLASMEHKTDFTGRSVLVPLQYGQARGRSKTVANSSGNQVPGKYTEFTVPFRSDYLTSSLEGPVVRRAAKGKDRTQFVNLIKNEMDGALEIFGQELAREAYAGQTGARAQVHPTTAISGTSLTLANPKDAVWFGVGDQIVASQTRGGALRDSGDFITLTGVNESTGVLTGDANWSNIASIAASDWLYVRGDQTGSSTIGKLGLIDYCPVTAPSIGESFLGTDRGPAPDQLAGRRYSGTLDSMATVFINMQAELAFAKGAGFANGAKIFINPIDFASLRISLEGSRFIDNDNEYGVGIESFRVGNMPIMPDPFCPKGYAYVVGKGAFYRATCGDQPGLNDEDSLEYRLNTATDVYEFQMVTEGNNVCELPHALCVVSLPTA